MWGKHSNSQKISVASDFFQRSNVIAFEMYQSRYQKRNYVFHHHERTGLPEHDIGKVMHRVRFKRAAGAKKIDFGGPWGRRSRFSQMFGVRTPPRVPGPPSDFEILKY